MPTAIVAARSSALGQAGALDQSCLNASDHPLVPIGDKPLEGEDKGEGDGGGGGGGGGGELGRTKLPEEEGRAESDDGVPTAEELSAVAMKATKNRHATLATPTKLASLIGRAQRDKRRRHHPRST